MPLVDTGVLLAAISPRDAWHQDCATALAAADQPLITTVAVLTELLCLVHEEPAKVELAWQFFLTGIVGIAAIEAADGPALAALMRRYADRPMDFADATLVHVAGRDGIADILTIDHDDFETYRFGRSRRFRILPHR